MTAMYSDKSCGMCVYCADVCCDYGVCELELLDAQKACSEEHYGRIDWDYALEWMADNLHDMQEDACDHFRPCVWES